MNDVVEPGWVVDEGYAEKYGKERRAATVEVGGFEARVLHTAEEELPEGRSHHVLAYVKVGRVEMGRRDGWHLGEDGLDARALAIAGEAVGRARRKLAGVREAALGVLAREEADADPDLGAPQKFEVFHYAPAKPGEGERPARDANVESKGEAVACATGLQEDHDFARRLARARNATPGARRCYYIRSAKTGACFFADGRAAPLEQGPVGPTGLGWDPDPHFPERAREASLWVRGMRAKVSDHFVGAPGDRRTHLLLSHVEVGGVDLGEEFGRHEDDEGLDGTVLDLAGRSAGKALEELRGLVAVAEELL